MVETVTDADLRGLLDVVDAARAGACGDSGMGFPPAALEAVCRVVACDSVAFLDLVPGHHEVLVEQSYSPGGAGPSDGTEGTEGTEGTADDVDAFWRHYSDCLGCSYPAGGDTRSITAMSDFYSQREYHASGMYAEYLGPCDVEREAMMCLPAPADHSRRLVFFRSGHHDFDGRDRLLLALLRPHLAEVDRELQRRRGSTELTPRQHELLRLVALGHSNREIAHALAISPGTVRKHLENIFERLGVLSRTAAVAKGLPAGSD